MYQKKAKDKYDFILGRNLLKDLGPDIHYCASQFVWDDIIVDMVPGRYWAQDRICKLNKTWNTKCKQTHEDITESEKEELHLAKILPAKCKPADIFEVILKQTHLTPDEQQQLYNVLLDFQSLFQGKKGECNGNPIELELLLCAKPFYGKSFLIPKVHQQIKKGEIARMESIGLLTKVTSSKWAAPTFIIPKKNQSVRVITDFRRLNKCLKRNPYPMPKIPDIFQGMKHFCYATTIDLNMGYYSMPLSEKAMQLCVISLPWGLYQYNMLPMVSSPKQTFSNHELALFSLTCPLSSSTWMIQ
jgi:hypothetical protein